MNRYHLTPEYESLVKQFIKESRFDRRMNNLVTIISFVAVIFTGIILELPDSIFISIVIALACYRITKWQVSYGGELLARVSILMAAIEWNNSKYFTEKQSTDDIPDDNLY